MSLILNLAWILCGGALLTLAWLIAAALMALTIVGLPWVPAALRIAAYTLLPFGRTIENAPGAGELSLLGNILWFVLAGWWLALFHLIHAVVLAVTIIGLPFAWAHLKLAGASLAPVGKRIVARG